MSSASSKDSTPQRENVYPLLPLRDVVIFPQMMVPLFVGRERSINALNMAMARNKEIVLATQKLPKQNEPDPKDVFSVGTLSKINQILKLPDGTIRVLVEGVQRVNIDVYTRTSDYFEVEVERLDETVSDNVELKALRRSVTSSFETYLDHAKKIPKDVLKSLNAIANPSHFADTIVLSLNLKIKERQDLLETVDPIERLEKLYEILQREIEILQVERRIKSRIKKQMDRQGPPGMPPEGPPRDGSEQDEFRNELNELEELIETTALSEEARTKATKELKKLKMMSPMSAEATVVRNYLDWMLSVPWDSYTDEINDIEHANGVLEEDHYGLEKPKERILEYLAVHSLVGELKGPILCFVGPPGVGKTSIAMSIARATGRKFVRLSLGGVRDEAEIRGHRRTYIGALPGKLIQSMKKAGACNPVFLLDEVDKLSSDYRGDPSSALLEALDPEQNHNFNDHYLDVDYDLSKVMFLTTANYLQNIPPALKDRMEIIELPGYTEHEKLEIAKRYLIPKQQKANGLADFNMSITDGALLDIVNGYTREAGVRNLEREIAKLMRKTAVQVLKDGKEADKEKAIKITAQHLGKMLGVQKFLKDPVEKEDRIGLSNGLAWTEVGGVLLQIETLISHGKGGLMLTGKLGDVMKESGQAALSWVKAQADALGLDRDFFQNIDIHIHAPEGAVPKDGPSAGVTIITTLMSAVSGIPVRHDVAMTGEITLRGRVLPIGGVKEKIMAAHRYNIKDVILPAENEKDLKEVPANIRKAMNLHLVSHMDEVLDIALSRPWRGAKTSPGKAFGLDADSHSGTA